MGAKLNNSPGLKPSRRFHERFPEVRFDSAQEQYLRLPAPLRPLAPEARRNDAAIVEDEDVALTQVISDFIEMAVRKRAVCKAGNHQPRLASRLDGRLSNKLRWQN